MVHELMEFSDEMFFFGLCVGVLIIITIYVPWRACKTTKLIDKSAIKCVGISFFFFYRCFFLARHTRIFIRLFVGPVGADCRDPIEPEFRIRTIRRFGINIISARLSCMAFVDVQRARG